MKRTISIVLSLLMFMGIFASLAPQVLAASTTAYDILSASNYAKVYTLASSGRTTPYTSKYLSVRGSVTYGKSSTAYIDNKTDELYLCDVGVTNGKYWAYVSYPVGSKRAYAYIPLSAITSNNGSHKKTTSKGKFYCAPRQGASTSSSYYVAKGDTVYLISTGSQYQLLYPTSNGKWRIAFCSKSDYTRYCDSSSKKTVAVSKVSFRSSSYSLKGKGSAVNILASVQPSNASNKSLSWKSSNTSVATVNAAGKVTAVGAGTATITATASNGKKASAKVKVSAVMSTRISLNTSSFTLSGSGATKTIKATLYPANSTDKVTWKSSNSSVATVNSSGKVTAVANGTARITATSTSGKSVSVTVSCKDIATFFYPVKNANKSQIFGQYCNWRNTPRYGYRPYHLGIDYCAAKGTKVYSITSGTVEFAGYGGSSNAYTVVIRHKISGKTVYSFYAHFDNQAALKVKKGDKVKAGQVIGLMGNSGSSTAPHTHVSVVDKLWNGSYFGYSPSFKKGAKKYTCNINGTGSVTYYDPEYIITYGKLP